MKLIICAGFLWLVMPCTLAFDSLNGCGCSYPCYCEYLPATLFRRLSDDFNLPRAPAHSIRYVAGVRDEAIYQIGLSMLSEMTSETAAGRMLVETASLALAARLVHKYCDSGSCTLTAPASHPLDHVRLRRVLDYISAHVADEITLADLARIAGLSTFHFARMFAIAIGVSPRR